MIAARAALMLGFSAACSPSQLDDTATETASGFTATKLEAATRLLTDLGPRASATPSETAARDAVVAALQDVGLEPQLAAFSWSPWVRGSAWISTDTASFEAMALSPSPSVVDLTLTLVDGQGDDIRDQAAFFRSSDGSRAEQFATALLGGAAAMVRVTDDLDDDGTPLVEVGHTLWGSSLPAVAVDRDTGDALNHALGAMVSLDITASLVEGHSSHNVVATLPGERDDMVFVTAHYDSWDISECAIDNALGVATLLLLAQRAALASSREYTLVFLVTAGEEQGVTGALEWVAANEDLVDDVELVLNLDIPWAAEGSYLVGASDDDTRAMAMAAARDQGLDPVDVGAPSLSSDHVPFVTRGAPAAWLTRWPDRHYHTVGDTADQLDYDEALSAAQANYAVLTQVAGISD